MATFFFFLLLVVALICPQSTSRHHVKLSGSIFCRFYFDTLYYYEPLGRVMVMLSEWSKEPSLDSLMAMNETDVDGSFVVSATWKFPGHTHPVLRVPNMCHLLIQPPPPGPGEPNYTVHKFDLEERCGNGCDLDDNVVLFY